MNYHVIIENNKTRYLRTKVTEFVIRLMLDNYKKYPPEGVCFYEFLNNNGIECIYDETFGYFNLDEEFNKGV